jgi:hypothetical protein
LHPVSGQLITQHARAHEGVLQMQLIQAAHQRQIARADGS